MFNVNVNLMKKIVFGIDVSSKTLDICKSADGKCESFVIANEVPAIRKFFKSHRAKADEVVVGMENTGRYNWALYEALEGSGFLVFVINPLHLKKSLGLVRGKNDRVDAERIAWFADRNRDGLPVWKPCSQTMKKIKVLFSERNSKIKLKAALMKQRAGYPQLKGVKLDKALLKYNEREVALISRHIEALEAAIEELIDSDADLREKRALMRSVPGVGKVLSWMMIAKTDGFSKEFTARKMACHAGVVPFDHQSGTSLRHRPKVSYYSDKSLKSVLHLAAMSTIRLDNDLRGYYLRKVAEGKNKMQVLNAVRNKIIHRIFALIKSGKPYEKNYKNHLVLS